MIPDPTPVSGIVPPSWSVDWPVAVIRTTAGRTFAATSMIADDSSRVTAWWFEAWAPLPPAGPARFSAPVASRTRTVPPEARTADRTAAVTMVRTPPMGRAGPGEV